MKKSILALTLLATTPLIGEADHYDNSSCCEQTCCPPKKCIDCECYTPQYYDLQCDWGLFVSGEFLYWYARETNLTYAIEANNAEIYPESAGDTIGFNVSGVEEFGITWKPGFRLGIGYNFCQDGWDARIDWTSFCSSRSDSASLPAFESDPDINSPGIIINPWRNSVSDDSDLVWNKISAKWSLDFNQIDLQLGRRYWLSRCFTIRPFAGLRGVWTDSKLNIDSSFDTTLIAQDTTAPPDLDQLRITHKNWGVGIDIGFQPSYHLTQCFALYSGFGASLLWGKEKLSHSETLSFSVQRFPPGQTAIDSSNQFSRTFYLMKSAVDIEIGLRWEDSWCCDRYKTRIDLGWEHHLWINFNHYLSFVQIPGNFRNSPGSFDAAIPVFSSNVNSDLMMGGFVLRAQFDF